MPGTALILIDIQLDYFEGGAFELDRDQATRALEIAEHMLHRARSSGAPIIHVRHETLWASPGFLRSGSPGAELHPRVRPRAGELVLTKHSPNPFVGTRLELALREQGVTRLVMGGMIAWMCIDSAVRAASELGFSVVVVPGMVASRALTWRAQQLTASQTLAAALAPLAFFSREASPDEAALLLSVA